MRDQWIAAKLKGLLSRRTPPQALRDKPELQAEEIASLVRAVLRHAPREGFQDWWGRFEDRLLAESATYSWPHPGDVEKAGRACYDKPIGRKADDWKPDVGDVNAQRIRNGEPVGDEFVYGRGAVDLLHRGLVSQEALDTYRSGFFFALREVYGRKDPVTGEWDDRKAREVERRYRDRHDAAADNAGLPRFKVRLPALKRMTEVVE